MKLAENLKKAVLQAAMQGKLTRQLKTDSSVDDLLQKIAEEKAALIKEGKIKKERGESLPLAPERKHSSATPSPRGTPPKTPDNSPQVFKENSESSRQRTTNARFGQIPQEEIPFEIPENWRWCRLGEIGDWGAGATPDRGKSEYYKNGTIPWIKTGELNDGIVTTAEEYITELALEKCSLRMNKKNDVLIAMYGATIGKVAIAGFDLTTNQACCACTPFKGIYNYYLFYFLKANKPNFIKQSAGGAQPNISRTKIIDTLFPLPPIEEQQRIVEKLNSILPLIDEYGKEEDELVALSQNFPEDIKKSVLQSAMQGKLTRQQQTDSSVDDLLKKIAEEKERLIKEGKIKKNEKFAGPLSDEEYPFEIPVSWKFLKIPDATTFQEGPGILGKDFRTRGIPLIRIAGMQEKIVHLTGCNYLDPEMVEKKWKHFKLDLGDVVISSSASMDKIAEVDEETVGAIAYTGLIRFKMLGEINKEFFKYYIQSPFYIQQINEQKAGGMIQHYGPTHLQKMFIPLPPIEEQQRIVEKLNQILPIIDSMAVYGTKKKSGRQKQEEALSFIRTFLQAKKPAQPKTATPEILELKAKAKQELPAAVQKYAGLMGVTYNRITIRHQKTRWGSCTKTGNLNFNCLIMKMPDQVRDYVIIHELAHLKELNHSPRFWIIVAEYCPWYKQAKQWLKDNGPELMER